MLLSSLKACIYTSPFTSILRRMVSYVLKEVEHTCVTDLYFHNVISSESEYNNKLDVASCIFGNK